MENSSGAVQRNWKEASITRWMTTTTTTTTGWRRRWASRRRRAASWRRRPSSSARRNCPSSRWRRRRSTTGGCRPSCWRSSAAPRWRKLLEQTPNQLEDTPTTTTTTTTTATTNVPSPEPNPMGLKGPTVEKPSRTGLRRVDQCVNGNANTSR